jgi:hypothetical protein
MSEILALRELGDEPDTALRRRLVESYEVALPFLPATVEEDSQ